MNLKASNKFPILLAVLAAACYGISSPISKLLLEELSPVFMAALLYLGAGLGMLAVRTAASMKKQEKKDFKFDKRAASYDDGFEGTFSKKFYGALLSRLNLKPSCKVLDVGCGTGYLLRKMADRQQIEGYGIDVEQNMIEIARAKCPDMAIQASACEKMPFEDGTFDILTACMAYHHFSDQAGFAKEAERILKPGGCLYIADPRFPFPVRKTINGIARLFKFAGKFFTPLEIADDFRHVGFELADAYCDGIVQVITMKKC